MELVSAQIQSHNDHWDFIDFFILQPTLVWVIYMFICINTYFIIDYIIFRIQCRNNDAKNDISRLTILHNHSLFIEFREITNKAMKELGETCVSLMHTQNVIANGLKEAETQINANNTALTNAQIVIANGLKDVETTVRETVHMQMDLATAQNELATTQNELAATQKDLAIANSETRQLQVDMSGIQNTFTNGLKEVERNIRELLRAQMVLVNTQRNFDAKLKDFDHILTAHNSRMDAKDVADKSFSNELLDLQEQQHVKITENALAIVEIASRCKKLVEQEKLNEQRAIDIYRYWKTANELYQGKISMMHTIDGIYKQYYNYTFDKKTDYIKPITDATLLMPLQIDISDTRYLGF